MVSHEYAPGGASELLTGYHSTSRGWLHSWSSFPLSPDWNTRWWWSHCFPRSLRALLGVLAFILEFIPILGTLVSGLICTVVALTQGWLIALGVLIYFIVVHILEGDVIGPRIVGKAVGLHPIVSIAALIAGAELFGIVGALFASPLAGVLQALLIALWINWRETRPEQFEAAKEGIADKIETSLSDAPTQISETENS